MENIVISPIPKNEIHCIIPLLQQLNKKTPSHLLKERLSEMATQNYECIGMYDKGTLIGICGIWTMTRHYVGKSSELDHVVIDENYRGQNLGKYFFKWIYKYLKSKGSEAVELNAYSENRKSHKFYYNENFEIYGFHFVKALREDQKIY